MSPDQKKLARHALGLDNPDAKRRSYRNRYVSSVEHRDWEALVAGGLAEKTHLSILYSLTKEGARAALEHGETLDPEDFP